MYQEIRNELVEVTLVSFHKQRIESLQTVHYLPTHDNLLINWYYRSHCGCCKYVCSCYAKKAIREKNVTITNRMSLGIMSVENSNHWFIGSLACLTPRPYLPSQCSDPKIWLYADVVVVVDLKRVRSQMPVISRKNFARPVPKWIRPLISVYTNEYCRYLPYGEHLVSWNF